MTTWLALAAVSVSAVVYCIIGWRIFRQNSEFAAHLPVGTEHAGVKSSREFSAATIATSISLATVILAYTELASYFGLWLLWTALTTSIGLWMVRLAAPRIWSALQGYGQSVPSLHQFMGDAYSSALLRKAAAICTLVGFVGALAVELSVGSRFLALLAPEIPAWAAVAGLSGIGVFYTALGGFRAVVITDRIQMAVIWFSAICLTVAILIKANQLGGLTQVLAQAPASMFDFSAREGLLAFLVGITIINIPTFLADMGVWQRISGVRDVSILSQGLTRSAIGAGISWSLFAVLACIISLIATSDSDANPLSALLSQLPGLSVFGAVLFFFIVIGMYAATLSTASTQLIASGHALQMDLLSDQQKSTSQSLQLRMSRILLGALAIASVLGVEVMRAAGFSISDLVFAVYGAQLGMVPAVLLALFMQRQQLKKIGLWVTTAVCLGFVAGWICAGYGKFLGNGNLVFLSPLASLATSTLIIAVGLVVKRK